MTEPRRRLSYTPQCVGSERTLRDCSTTSDGSESCDAPLLISCYSQQSSTMTSPPLPSSLSLPSQLVLRPSPSSYTSLLKLHPSATRQSTFSTLTPVVDAVLPSSLTPPTTPFPSLSPLSPEVVVGAIGGVVMLLGAVILTFVVIFICRRRQRVKKPRTKSIVVHIYEPVLPTLFNTNQTRSPQPYQHPVSSGQSNISHQETNPRHTEMTASSQPSLDSVQYHRLNHFPASGTSPGLHSQAVISPSAHYDMLQRSIEDIAGQYRQRENSTQHQSTENVIDNHQYDKLQKLRGSMTEREEMSQNIILEGANKNVKENQCSAIKTSTGKETKNGYDVLKPANSGSDPMNFVMANLQQEAKPANSVNDPMNFIVPSLQQEESCSQPPTPSSGCSSNSLTTLL